MTTSRTDELTVRYAGPEDVDTLVDFSAAMAKETEGRALDRERLRRGTLAVFESPDRGFYLVAEVGQGAGRQVVGQLLVTYEWSDWRNATFWWIQSVYVHPAWRRRGVYRRLHETVLQWARERKDVCGIRLYVEGENRIAQAAYVRAGLAPSSYRVFEQDFVLPRGEPE
ncbi:MAG: GNAT family N-acetyltransferase [Nitrospirota bacterium]